MDPRHHLFLDERHAGPCVYCGDPATTDEHVPSKVFLDEPYPTNRSIVRACADCNGGFSLDEEYVAVALECAQHGSADPDVVSRPKVARILTARPALARRVAEGLEGPSLFGEHPLSIDRDRLKRVIAKLARSHAAYENGQPVFDEPSAPWIATLPTIGARSRTAFEQVPMPAVYPEIGSWAFRRMAEHVGTAALVPWVVVQANRYRYLFTPKPFSVRLVISEYLAAVATWE